MNMRLLKPQNSITYIEIKDHATISKYVHRKISISLNYNR